MDPALRLAVELPPVPAAAPASLEPWWETARAAVRAGAGIVWFTGGASDDVGAPAQWCDACTIAAAAASVVDDVLLGVVSGLPADRHPAVLAREVTGLDHVSGGRAAVGLRWTAATAASGIGPEAVQPLGGPAAAHLPEGLSAACAYLGEAVAVCRAVLQDDDPVFEGRYLHVAGAVNRPPPLRPGGPPLFVQVPTGAAGLVRREPGASFLLRQAATGAAGIVCPDDAGEIAAWRLLVEDAAAAVWTGDVPGEAPPVVCRATLPSALTSALPGRDRGVAPDRSRLEAARAAGAEGVVVRLPASRREDEVLHVDVDEASRITGELSACFDPWRD